MMSHRAGLYVISFLQLGAAKIKLLLFLTSILKIEIMCIDVGYKVFKWHLQKINKTMYINIVKHIYATR